MSTMTQAPARHRPAAYLPRSALALKTRAHALVAGLLPVLEAAACTIEGMPQRIPAGLRGTDPGSPFPLSLPVVLHRGPAGYVLSAPAAMLSSGIPVAGTGRQAPLGLEVRGKVVIDETAACSGRGDLPRLAGLRLCLVVLGTEPTEDAVILLGEILGI